MPIPTESGLDHLEAARARALESLTSAAAGDSLCTLERERLPTAKYFEGAVSALSDAISAARNGEPSPDPATWGDWAATLAKRDSGWRAYLVGGREALSAASA